MNYTNAKSLADELLIKLLPYFDKIEIAGSIRRQKQFNIKDIELVAIPKRIPVKTSLFDNKMQVDPTTSNFLSAWKEKSNDPKGSPSGKYMKLTYKVQVDLFMTTDKNWGYIKALRTGSRDFNFRILSAAKNKGVQLREGSCFFKGNHIPVPTEKDFFDLIGLEMIDPKLRK